LENNIKYWDMIDKNNILLNSTVNNWKLLDFKYFLNLPQFSNWLVGFSEAEASFGIKKNNSAFYNIRQTGIENLNLIKAIQFLIKAIQFLIKGKVENEIKPDSSNSYQISFTSKKDIQTIVNFFFFFWKLFSIRKQKSTIWIMIY
jgi:hypothetical protein